MYFMPVQDGDLAPDDRVGVVSFLEHHALRVDTRTHRLVSTHDGVDLTLGGVWTDLQLDPLEQPEPLTGSLSHAKLTEAECAFVFGLCSAGRMMIVSPQGHPTYIGLEGIHTLESFPDTDDAVMISSPADLASALEGTFGAFRAFVSRAIDGDGPAGP